MQDLELYRYQRSNGGRGHISGYGEQDARHRLASRGLGDVDELKIAEDTVEDLAAEESLTRALDVQLRPALEISQDEVASLDGFYSGVEA